MKHIKVRQSSTALIKAKSIFLTLTLAFILGALTIGCGVPGQNGIDRELQNSVSYHRTNNQCESVDLSSTNFTPASLRSLMTCLNANNQMPELNALVQSSRDEELAPITEFLSRTILTKPARLYQIDQTLQLLDQNGLLATNFDQMSRFLNNGSFVSSAIHLLHHGYFSSLGGILDYITNGLSPAPNEEVLKALEEFGKEITISGVAESLDYGLTLTSARVNQSLQARFRSTRHQQYTRTLNDIIRPLMLFLKSGSEEGRVDLGKRLITLLVEGPLWQAMDRLLVDSDPQWLRIIPKWNSLVTTLYREEGRFFRDAPEMMQALAATASTSITCMRGASRLSNLTPQRVFAELNQLTLKEFLSSLIVARPFCDFPSAILNGASSFMPIAASDASETLEEWVRTFNQDPRLVSFMIDVLSENDSIVRAIPILGRSGNRLRHLGPLVWELQDRGAWNDALLLSTLVRISDRPRINAFLQSLIAPRESLQSKSIYDVLAPIVPRMDIADLEQFVRTLQPFVDSGELMAAPFLSSVRESFYANDVHPGIDLVKETLVNARENKEFFTALFKIVGRNGVQFARVVSEVAAMARREDGRLRDLSLSLMSTFRHFSGRSAVPIAKTQAPAFVPRWRHNITSDDLVIAPPSRAARPNAFEACSRFDFNFSVADYESPQFANSFQTLTQCLAFHDNDLDVERSLRFVSNSNLLGGQLQGKSLLSWVVDTVRDFAGSDAAVSDLASRFLDAVRDRRLHASLNAMPFWVQRTQGQDVGSGDSVIDPLLRLLNRSLGQTTPLSNRQQERERKLALLRSKSASVCSFYREDEEATGVLRCEQLPVEQAVRNQLALWEPHANINQRINEIYSEFLDSVEHDYSSEQARIEQHGELLRSWPEDLLAQKVSTVVQYMINPRDSSEDPERLNQHKVLEGILRFPLSINAHNNSFDHELHAISAPENIAGAFASADRLAEWTIEQANTLTVFPYHYRGETKPRVRLMSLFDQLGLILENTDLVLTNREEPGIMGLALSTNSWLEERPEDRPPFARDDTTVKDLPNLVASFILGLPGDSGCLQPDHRDTPEDELGPDERACLGRLRNYKGFARPGHSLDDEFPQTIEPPLVALFQNYIPESGNCSGSDSCFGLRLIRNIFTSIFDKTPEPYRVIMDQSFSFRAQKHNMKIMQHLAKAGVFRYGSRLMFGMSPQDPDFKNLTRSLIVLTQSPDYPLVLDFLKTLLDPSERGVWRASDPVANRGLVRRLFDVLYAISGDEPARAAAAQTLFYGAAALPTLHLMEDPTNIMGAAFKVLTGAASPTGGRALIIEHAQAFQTLLDSPFSAQLLETFYLDSKQSSTSQWQLLRDRYIALQSNPRYPRAEVDRLVQSVVSFLHHPPTGAESGSALYQQVLRSLLVQIKEGKLEELLRLTARNPDEIYVLSATLARFQREGHAQELLDMLGRFLETTGTGNGSSTLAPAPAPAAAAVSR